MLNTIDRHQEKRQFARVPVELDVSLHLMQEGRPVSIDVTVRDLSLTGLGLSTARLPLRHNQDVEVTAVCCAPVEAKVQWTSARGFGLHITQKPERVARSWVGHVLELKGVDVSSVCTN